MILKMLYFQFQSVYSICHVFTTIFRIFVGIAKCYISENFTVQKIGPFRTLVTFANYCKSHLTESAAFFYRVELSESQLFGNWNGNLEPPRILMVSCHVSTALDFQYPQIYSNRPSSLWARRPRFKQKRNFFERAKLEFRASS